MRTFSTSLNRISKISYVLEMHDWTFKKDNFLVRPKKYDSSDHSSTCEISLHIVMSFTKGGNKSRERIFRYSNNLTNANNINRTNFGSVYNVWIYKTIWIAKNNFSTFVTFFRWKWQHLLPFHSQEQLR